MQRFGKLCRLLLFGIVCVALVLGGFFVAYQRSFEKRIEAYLSSPAGPPGGDGGHLCVSAVVLNHQARPSISRCALPVDLAQDGVLNEDRFEADLRYGTFLLRQTDIRLGSGTGPALTRGYNSDHWPGIGRSAAFGRNSSHNFDLAPLGSRNPYLDQVLVLADGQEIYFKRVSPGVGFADAVFQHSETSTRFYGAVTGWNGDGWTTRLRDGSRIRFPESYNARNLAQGAASAIQDASGRTLRLLRDPERNLREVLSSDGHRLALTYDNFARVIDARSDSGTTAKYAYDAEGLLASVSRSGGQKRFYTYEDGRMTSITDESGTVLLRNRYKGTMLYQQQYSDGSIYEYRYHLNPRRTFADQVFVTLPDHSLRTFAVAADVPTSSREP